jgi:hypothetical protein
MTPPFLDASVPKTHGPVPKVGSRARMKLGKHPMEVLIVEDRGNLGARGERLALVAFPADADPEDARTFEVEVSRLDPV